MSKVYFILYCLLITLLVYQYKTYEAKIHRREAVIAQLYYEYSEHPPSDKEIKDYIKTSLKVLGE